MPVIKVPKDDRGLWRVGTLIHEYPSRSADPKWVPEVTFGPEDFTDKDGNEITSLHRIYMECADPTEYDFAQRVFGSWKHWQRWQSNAFVRQETEKLREELEILLKSRAIKDLITHSTKKADAAKYVAEYGWKKRKAGRPSKEEVERETKIQGRVRNSVHEDMERLGLKVVNKD